MPPVRRNPSRHPRRRRVVLLVLAVVLALVVGVVGWRQWSTRPRGEPQAVELAAATVSPALGDATVLALGEATHGNAELQLARLTLVQKLPRFRAIVLEEDYGSVALVNEWVQGGPGTAQDAARRFGFALNHTAEMAELLQWIREQNAGLPASQRIQLIGMDVQRVDANKQVALDWLATHDDAEAGAVRAALADWTDETSRGEHADELRVAAAPAVDRLLAAIEDVDPGARGRQVALDAATALRQHLELKDAAGPGYAATRARIMAANVQRTVQQQRERGNEHALLFAHNGHVDKVSAAYRHRDLGELLAERFGDGYRVIGTEVHDATIRTGDHRDRWEVTLHNPTPLRGMFAGTQVGYLEFADASPVNRELLSQPVRMASAGERFQQWQAWSPWTSTVTMVPAESYDALVLVDRATPVTPL